MSELEIKALSCVRDDRLLISDLSITVKAGQMLHIEGKNGSGKTSLLRILTGLSRAESGEVLWQGESIESLSGEYYEQVNYIGHHDGIKRDLTCLENLRMAQAIGKPKDIDLDDALKAVNLYAFGENQAATLSAGQKRRLALARLVVTEAPFWIMDEPFTSLDTASIHLFEQLFLSHLDSGGLIAMTSHHALALKDQADLIRLNLSDRLAK
ncbi:MAG: cytochrome c biogenesis heme-transporting ATPase CcmA [Gammaproteobacteria bacterium]|nr:cytochrome c biogenesis heme-transporting ATPase CcmA [Gammaproteobacteria bacterium]